MEPTGEHRHYDPMSRSGRLDAQSCPLSHRLTDLMFVGYTDFVLFVFLLLKDFPVIEVDFLKKWITGSKMQNDMEIIPKM